MNARPESLNEMDAIPATAREALNRAGGAAPTTDATSFPYLAPLAAYERHYGHHAAAVGFIESVWALLDEPSNAIPTKERGS